MQLYSTFKLSDVKQLLIEGIEGITVENWKYCFNVQVFSKSFLKAYETPDPGICRAANFLKLNILINN